MKIIYAEQNKGVELTFGMVDEDEFFVYGGDLYQKVDHGNANMIAIDNGTLCAARDEFGVNDIIDRIIPKIAKIEF